MNTSINKILGRDSNFEIARIVAMLLILSSHAFNPFFWNSLSNSINTVNIFVILGQSFTKCAVGLLILISGWYGITPKGKSVRNIVFQVIFYGLSIAALGRGGWKAMKDVVLLSPALWFLKSYFLLYILSPVLNSFVATSSKKQFKLLLIAFFLFQSVWGWTNTALEFNYGLSVVFFIFMYLLARYLRLYLPAMANRSAMSHLLIYCSSSLLIAAILFIKHYYGIIPFLTKHMIISLINPLMVLCSVSLFLFFSKVHFKSKIINWVAGSCLSVYLIHENPLVAPLYHNKVWEVLIDGDILLFLAIILGVFSICVIIDQLRQLIYHQVIERIFTHKKAIDYNS